MTTTDDLCNDNHCWSIPNDNQPQECAFCDKIKLTSGEIVANNICSDDPW